MLSCAGVAFINYVVFPVCCSLLLVTHFTTNEMSLRTHLLKATSALPFTAHLSYQKKPALTRRRMSCVEEKT